jgi:hypothetical protein
MHAAETSHIKADLAERSAEVARQRKEELAIAIARARELCEVQGAASRAFSATLTALHEADQEAGLQP